MKAKYKVSKKAIEILQTAEKKVQKEWNSDTILLIFNYQTLIINFHMFIQKKKNLKKKWAESIHNTHQRI